MYSARSAQTRCASATQARPVRTARVCTLPRRPRFHVHCKAQGALSGFSSNLSVPNSFNAAIRFPPMMADVRMEAAGGAGAVMERSKLAFKQTTRERAPELDTGGDGGDIGKILRNGGDGGDGDDDDDDYFNSGDGDGDGDEGRWWHRVPLTQLYDNASVQAVLSEWCLTVEKLPGFLKLLAQMPYYSTAQWVRYLTVQDRPNLFRTIERLLARFPDARSGFVGRMLADPAFLQKTALEGGIATGIAMVHEVHVRGKRITQELDYALINAFCIGGSAAVCSALVAPSKTPLPQSAKFPWQRMLQNLPNNAFEKNTPARAFEVPQRLSGFVAKGVEVSAVNAIAGGASAALQQCATLARQSRNRKYTPVTPVPDVARAAGGMGVYGGLAANCRLQAAAGLERVLLEYAKVSTTWQVMGLATAFRGLTQFALENPFGWGPKVVTACSRPAMEGTPVHYVKAKRKRKVKRKKVPAAQQSAQAPTAQPQGHSDVDALLQGAGYHAGVPAPA